MEVSRIPVVFPNRQGLRLFGVLHLPQTTARSELGVILLSPGVKMRVGPERLYCVLTERLVQLGLPVLRFDFYGLGDSEGELGEEWLKDVYNHIEVGRFVDDTIDSMEWMFREHGLRRFIMSGLCGGAITGLLAAQHDSRVAGLLALGITPVLASRSADPAKYMTSGQAAAIRRSYLAKALNPLAWLRLLTFRSDYRLLWRSLRRRGRAPVVVDSPAPEDDNANPLFPPAFFSMVESRRPVLMVFGGSDRLVFEFEEKFVARHRARVAAAGVYCQVHTITQANHVLSFGTWQQEMLAVSTEWVQRWFSADLRRDVA
jgi:pimeloyl-ACP methyl ester carboxylesterase